MGDPEQRVPQINTRPTNADQGLKAAEDADIFDALFCKWGGTDEGTAEEVRETAVQEHFARASTYVEGQLAVRVVLNTDCMMQQMYAVADIPASSPLVTTSQRENVNWHVQLHTVLYWQTHWSWMGMHSAVERCFQCHA